MWENVPSGPRYATADMMVKKKTGLPGIAGQIFRLCALGCMLAFAASGCVQHKVTTTELYGPNAPMQAPTPKPAKIRLPISVQIAGIVMWPYTKVSGLFPHKKKNPVAQPPPWVGTVRVVNANEKFVLIDGLTLTAAQPGDTLIALSGLSESSTLRMTGLTQPPFVIADIVTGRPSVGDKVYAPKKTVPQ
jgi:hypothetical protein